MKRFTVPFFDYLRQYEAIRNDIDRAVMRVIASGRVILGPEVRAFEERFAAFCRRRFGIGVNSGTDAIHIALRAAGVGAGDDVVTVPNTSVATVSAICSAGARPVFADIREDTYLMDPASLERRITPKTRAIVPVHLFGQVAEMDPILQIASARGIMVIEDCAQAHGAEYKGKRAGSFGRAGCFSFYPTKNLGAFGDGGMIVTDDEEFAARAFAIRIYGFQTRDISAEPGINSRLDEIQAAILLAKLPHVPDWNQRRYEVAMQYKRRLARSGLTLPVISPNALHIFHQFVVRARHREALMRHLDSQGIQAVIHYPMPIHLQPGFRYLGLGPGTCPVSERVQQEIVSLPMFPELTAEEIEAVARAIDSFFRSVS